MHRNTFNKKIGKKILYNIALNYIQSEIRKNISSQYYTETLSKPVKTFLCSARRGNGHSSS